MQGKQALEYVLDLSNGTHAGSNPVLASINLQYVYFCLGQVVVE